MDTPDLMRAIADRIDEHKDAIGLRGVSYPATNTVEASPWAMVRRSSVFPSTVEKARLGQQVHLPMIDIVVLVTSDPRRPGDAARLDAIEAPLLDLFDASANGGNVGTILPDLDGHVDRVWDAIPGIRVLPLEWGEAGYCHALIVTFNAKYRRTPEAIA